MRRLGLLCRILAVIGQVQRAFLTTGRYQAGNRDERSKGRDQALHGEILENALIAPEYTGHPAACLCDAAPVRRAFDCGAVTCPALRRDISYRTSSLVVILCNHRGSPVSCGA
ncbi:hypothetical protein PGR6_55930 [Pseudomonas sp. GR 6-02]|nr:hypothetical protein PGR6_55930 [Pseudomonas sp. GR 6-02]